MATKNKRISPEELALPSVGVDTHAHLVFADFQNDLEEVLRRAKKCGLKAIGNIYLSSQEFITHHSRINSAEIDVFNVIGIHPHDAQKLGLSELERIKQLLARYEFKAIGEIGLDYHYHYSPPQVQQQVFEAQLELAINLGLPVVIHSREAAEDTLAILNKFQPQDCIFHCFSYNLEVAKKILDKGWFISFSGTLTFKKNISLKQVAAYAPLEMVLLETDCPFLAPHPYRGKRNEPAFTLFTAYELARLKNLDVTQVWSQTGQNAKKVFKIITS